jgi:transposase
LKLHDHDLRQLDEASLRRLFERDPQALLGLSERLLADLKEARERLNQNPDNSSRPPSSREPWSRNSTSTPRGEAAAAKSAQPTDDQPSDDGTRKTRARTAAARPPGRQSGAPGHGRTQELAITQVEEHRPHRCARCGVDLSAAGAVAYSGYEQADVVFGTEQAPGLHLVLTQHRLLAQTCPACGHDNRAAPFRAPPAIGDWAGVELSAWRLIGPGLAALLVWVHFDLHLSVRRCRLLCLELFGLSLSVGAIAEAIHKAACACEPIPPQIQAEVQAAALVYADETPHFQSGEFLWLWVLACHHSVLYFIGRRTQALFRSHIGADFAGWLMSDGYAAYRDYAQRLRCWAHLIRKARALAETCTPHVQGYGSDLLDAFDHLIEAVRQARDGPPQDLRPRLAGELAALQQLAEKMARSRNEKARRLGVERLNDWAAVFRVLDQPHLPLTNNFAERLLRPLVIFRRITQGTRTAQGSLALATFASIIGTCRLRHASPLRYLHHVIAARHQGLEAPALPPVPANA